MDVVMLISWSHYYNRRGMFMIEKLEEYGRFLFGWAFRAMQSEMTMQESLNAKSERAYLTGTEIALLEDSSLFIIGIGILVLMEAFFVVVVIITCEYETAELRMEDVPVENLLCIVSDECSEGLEVADGQRKRTLDAIMKALGFELLEFAELEDLDHILSRDQKAAFYRAFDEFRCDFYGEEREFVIVLIKGENAPLLSETDIFVELDYFVISFEGFFIMIYPSETGFCDGYVEITYGIGFLSWNLIPLLQMLYGKLNGNVEEFFNRSVMEQEAQPL